MTFYDWCVSIEKQHLLADWDYEKNDPLTPKDISKASNERVWWKCHVCGHEWETQVNNRYCGSGCRICGYKRVSISRRTPKPGTSLQDNYPELSEEWHPTKNDGLTPSDISIKSNRKVWWRGKECGHEWLSAVYSRTSGSGCPVCANLKVLIGENDLETVMPDLAKEWHPSKNGLLTAKDVVAKANRKVWWQCSICGNEWQAVLAKRAVGQGCPVCAKGVQTSFPEKAIAFYLREAGIEFCENYRSEWLDTFELDIYIPDLNVGIEYDGYAWHQNTEKDIRKNALCAQNDVKLIRIREDRCPLLDAPSGTVFLIPNRNDEGLNTGIRFIMSTLQVEYEVSACGNVVVDVAADRMKIYDLLECRKQENSFAEMCPELIDEWDYEKNGTMTPEDVTPFSDKKVWWKCRKYGHSWEAVVKSRTKGTGCPICSGNRVLAGFNDLATVSPELAREWHPVLNDPLAAQDVTPQSGLKVWWKCPVCNFEWQAAIYSRNGAKHGCPECGRKRVHAKLRIPKPGCSLLERNPTLAAQWHPEKNDGLQPQNVTLKTHQKVWWICPHGHGWQASVYSRSNGNGCPECYRMSRSKKVDSR